MRWSAIGQSPFCPGGDEILFSFLLMSIGMAALLHSFFSRGRALDGAVSNRLGRRLTARFSARKRTG